MFKKQKTFGKRLILILSLSSFSIFNVLMGCDNAPSAADTASTSEGNPVSLNPADPSVNIPPPDGGDSPASPENNEPLPAGAPSSVKKVILVIASGMGPQQIGQLVQYRRLRKPAEEKFALEKLMDKKIMGLMTTHSYLDLVSDTASANSSIACGLKTRNNTLGLDANGKPCEGILNKAAKMGKSTGLVSNSGLSDAGVAAYLAHHLDSQEENEVAAEILSEKNIDVLLSGGMENLIPQYKTQGGALTDPSQEESLFHMTDLAECAGLDTDLDSSSKRTDQDNLIDQAKTNGYQFVCKKDQLSGIAATDQTKVLGIFSGTHFPRSPERKGLSTLPSLEEMTSKALEILDKKPNGFLLVIHDGLPRFAAQENDPGTLLQEELDFDTALGVALDYAEKNSDTLLLVTSDHETGGFAFSTSKQAGNDLNLPNGDHYVAPYNYAPWTRYDLLIDQQKSFYAMTKGLVNKLYGSTPTLDLDTASDELVADVQSNTPFKISVTEAKEILSRAPGADNAQTQDFAPFFTGDNIHSNLMGRAVASQTSTVWSSGTASSTPVLIFASGPSIYAERVRGLIDNTDIGKIIVDALAGR